MLKANFSGWFPLPPYRSLLAAALLVAPNLLLHSQAALAEVPTSTKASQDTFPSAESTIKVPATATAPNRSEPAVQIDPLDSPHPIPWNWVLTTHAEVAANGGSGLRYYRSPSLISPDGQFAAYTRIQMDVQPELHRSRVTSVLFLENLRTGNLRTIIASSPLASNPFAPSEEADMPGTISILMPISWSSAGELLLARQFEGIFSTSDASDYAVIWDRRTNTTRTLTPTKVDYTHAVLLGWSKSQADRILFRAGNLGDDKWPLWAVDQNGETLAANEDPQPIIFGQFVNNLWAGPQALK
jgi:hypothetical protein